MTAKILPLISRKKDRFYDVAGEAGRTAIYNAISDDDNLLYLNDVSVALIRTAYECFYQLYRMKIKPSVICEEIDYFHEKFEENIPALKRNIWRWYRNEKKER